MRCRIVLLALTFFVVAVLTKSQPAKAWGRQGHLTICDLAYRNFTPATRAIVRQLFTADRGGIVVRGRGKMADRYYTAFNVGCLEEDSTPRRHPGDHFINLARDIGAIDGNACPAGDDCILSGIARDLAILRDPTRSREERVVALMAVGHWVGDIHQPLHISFADDRGGNGIEVQLSGRCGTSTTRPKNLHAVWDNCLLDAGLFERVRQRADFKRSWSRNTITYRAVDSLQANTGLAEEMALVVGEPWQWAQESYVVTRAPATSYCLLNGIVCRYSDAAETLRRNAPKRIQPINQAYLVRHAPVAETRVRAAGFRLAHLVNTALDPDYRGPVRNTDQPA